MKGAALGLCWVAIVYHSVPFMKQSAKFEEWPIFVVAGVIAVAYRLFLHSRFTPQTKLNDKSKPHPSAIKVRCQTPESIGWLYIQDGLLCYDAERFSIRLSRKDVRFASKPTSDWFNGEILSDRPDVRIRFNPLQSNWANSQASKEFEALCLRFDQEQLAVEPSVFPPVTVDPLIALPIIPKVKLFVSLVFLAIAEVASYAFIVAIVRPTNSPTTYFVFLGAIIITGSAFWNGYWPRLVSRLDERIIVKLKTQETSCR